MPKQLALSTSARLYSTAGTFGEIQIVATSHNVVLDVLGRNYDTDGRPHAEHAITVLPIQTAVRLRDLLDAAIAASDEIAVPQPGLWSDATLRAVAERHAQ